MGAILDFLIDIPGFILRVCNAITHNYVLALFLFSVVVELALLPFSIKQQKNQIRQAKLRPKEMAIRNKYKGRNDQATQQKVQNEIMDMYQRENFNPMQGCLPLLIQFPIILALYQVVINPLKYICQLSDEIITAVNTVINTLPGYESFVGRGSETIQQMAIIRENFSAFTGIEGFTEKIASVADLPQFTFFGGALDLSQTPSFDNLSWLLVIPVLTFVVSFLSTKITRKFTYQPTTAENDKQAGCSNAMMDVVMPLMSVYIAFIVPSAIGVYWIFKNIVTTIKQILIAKLMPIPVVTEEEMRAAEKEYNLSNRQRKKQEKVRSLHHIDDDDYEDTANKPADKAEPKEEETPAAEPEQEPGLIAPAPLKDDDRPKKKKK